MNSLKMMVLIAILMIKSNKECIKPNPWSEVKLEMPLFIGKNFFWVDNFDDKTEFTLKINEDQEIKMEIKRRRN